MSGESDVLMWPDGYRRDGTKTGLVICHGAGELSSSVLNPPGSNKLAEAWLITRLAQHFPLVAADHGIWAQGGTSDSNSWGNTNAQTRVGQAITWLQSASGGGAKTGKVVMLGISMGHTVAFNYAKNNPANVAALVGIIPVCDLDDIRDNNRGSYRGSISTAWGVGAWTAPGTPALPAGANPATDRGSFGTIPHRTYYSEADTIINPVTVRALSTALGASSVATQISTTLDHSDAAVGAAPCGEIINFLRSVG